VATRARRGRRYERARAVRRAKHGSRGDARRAGEWRIERRRLAAAAAARGIEWKRTLATNDRGE